MREETIYRASAHNALQRAPQSIQWWRWEEAISRTSAHAAGYLSIICYPLWTLFCPKTWHVPMYWFYMFRSYEIKIWESGPIFSQKRLHAWHIGLEHNQWGRVRANMTNSNTPFELGFNRTWENRFPNNESSFCKISCNTIVIWQLTSCNISIVCLVLKNTVIWTVFILLSKIQDTVFFRFPATEGSLTDDQHPLLRSSSLSRLLLCLVFCL